MNNKTAVVELGSRLRAVRKAAALSQDAVGTALGMKPFRGHAYVSELEKGRLLNVGFLTVVRYLQACKVPVGKFMLDLAQSGALGEAEPGLTIAEDTTKTEDARRAKAKLLYQKRWEREAEDAAIVAGLWKEVLPAIQPLLAALAPSRRHMAPYLEGLREFYRAWKLATRGAANRDPTLDVQMAFDRIERAGVQRLVPAAVRKMREVVFERLTAMTPRSGNT